MLKINREEKFLKSIMSDENRKGKLTYIEVIKLLNQKTGEEKSRISEIAQKVLKIKEKSAIEIIKNNFRIIITKTTIDQMSDLLFKILLENNEFNDEIRANFDLIVLKINSSAKTRVLIEPFFKKFMQNESSNKKFISDNIELITSKTNSQGLLATAQALKGISEECDEKLNLILERNKVKIAKSIFLEPTKMRSNTKLTPQERAKEIEEYAEILEMIITEILEHEGKRLIDLKMISKGAYSNVYKIGDLILKIGAPRKTYNMPNSRRILQPIIRKNIRARNGGILFCIEVTQRVEIDVLPKEQQEEILYDIYKEIRKEGKIWTDVKAENVGRLLNDNVPKFEGITGVSPETVGFDKHSKGEPLQKGELVVIDTDYIYMENEKRIDWPRRGEAIKFERRYQQECQADIAVKYKEKQNSRNNKEQQYEQ